MFFWSLRVAALLISLAALPSCKRAQRASAAGVHPTIASLVPAATDLIIALHGQAHLVAVSNFEPASSAAANLPRVGDYQNVDWEKLAETRPDIMVIFMAPDRIPAGLQQRADELHIKLINVKPERLADVFAMAQELGLLLQLPNEASELVDQINNQLDSVSARVRDLPRVRTIVALGDDSFDLVGRETFVNDLLEIAGGRNVIDDPAVRYPTVDRERVIELAPQAVVTLAPNAAASWKADAARLWQSLPQLPAVAGRRVYLLDDSFVLQPGSHVGELAEKLAALLHPQP